MHLMNRKLRYGLSLGLGAVILAGTTLGAGLALGWGVAAALVTAWAVSRVLPRDASEQARTRASQRLNETIQRGQKVANRLYYLSNQVRISHLAKGIRALSESCRELCTLLRQNPDYLDQLDFFLNVQIDDVLKVFDQFAELSKRSEDDEQIARALEDRAPLITAIQEEFDQQKSRLVRRELTKFEVTSDALSQLMGVEEIDYAAVKSPYREAQERRTRDDDREYE